MKTLQDKIAIVTGGTRAIGKAITFEEAVMSLRTISALASILNLFVLLKIIGIFLNSKSEYRNPKQYSNQKFRVLKFEF